MRRRRGGGWATALTLPLRLASATGPDPDGGVGMTKLGECFLQTLTAGAQQILSHRIVGLKHSREFAIPHFQLHVQMAEAGWLEGKFHLPFAGIDLLVDARGQLACELLVEFVIGLLRIQWVGIEAARQRGLSLAAVHALAHHGTCDQTTHGPWAG